MITTDHTPQRSAPVDGAEGDTRGLSAGHPFVVDSLALLDHRTRELTIPAQGAPAGRYLSIGDGAERRLLPLQRPITHVGRGLVADFRLEDPHVSRRHAIVALRGEGVRVLDDRSANGTFVNGRAVTVAHLSDGDVLRFGRAVFRYTEVAGAPSGHVRPLRRGGEGLVPLARRAPNAGRHAAPPAAA
jgi:hypothetical protein